MVNNCPSDEMMACFAEGLLSPAEAEKVQAHLKTCAECAQIIEVQKACVLARAKGDLNYVPQALLEKIISGIRESRNAPILDIVILFKDKIIEALRTTGEILPALSQNHLVFRGDADGFENPMIKESPAGYSASAMPKAISSEIIMIRELFGDVEIVVEISRQTQGVYRVLLRTSDAKTKLVKEDLRINLCQLGCELESKRTVAGRVVLEGLSLGQYVIQVEENNQIIGNVNMNLRHQ